MSTSLRHTGEAEVLNTFLTSELVKRGWSTSCPHCFTAGEETWYPLNRRLDRQFGHSGGQKKLLLLPGLEPQIIQPVAESLH